MKMSCFSSVFICKTLKAPLKTHYTCSSGSVSHRLWLSMNRFGLEGSGTSRSADKNCVWEGSVFRDRQNWLCCFTAAWLIQWLQLCQQVDITAFYKKNNPAPVYQKSYSLYWVSGAPLPNHWCGFILPVMPPHPEDRREMEFWIWL